MVFTSMGGSPRTPKIRPMVMRAGGLGREVDNGGFLICRRLSQTAKIQAMVKMSGRRRERWR